MDRHGLVELAQREQVVDPNGLRALEIVVGRLDVIEPLEPDEILGQRLDHVGIYDLFQDREAVPLDARPVRRQRWATRLRASRCRRSCIPTPP
jgi:hypothetical protein